MGNGTNCAIAVVMNTTDPTDPTNTQFAACRAMWAYFNVVLFGGSLGRVILNFSRLARSLGFFAPERWRDAGDQVTHEISLSPAHLKRDNAKVNLTLKADGSVGKGRVFVNILGHYTWTLDDPLARILILRGIMWCAHEPQVDRLSSLATLGARIDAGK